MGQVPGNQIIGKVKTVTMLQPPTPHAFGRATFCFRNEYSIFDFGRMPDEIPFKGESLCRMAVHNFMELQKTGMRTHFVKRISPLEFEVKTVRVLYPESGEISPQTTNFLIPLEIIFRNMLPRGSSMLKRLQSGALKPGEVGLTRIPKEGERLQKPIIDYTTKLEKADRHLKNNEARVLACMTEKEFAEMEQMALKVNAFLNEKAESIGLEHADGKIEMAFTPKRELMLVDTFGTLDEDRFLLNGMHLSKQVIRDYYAKTQWGKEIEKKEAGLPYHLNAPKPLPRDLVDLVSCMYQSVCESWVGERIWNAPPVEEIVQDINAYTEKINAM
ncbi:MAG: phosphoribosylaminoimidazolesuccinocarboxamide synthase [Candidatus Diapherotrites archaeon]|nr:phosphoribosylaminoimidazolesuccinocarboxamide synthase [Candidatus Diapherotrites archaeon]